LGSRVRLNALETALASGSRLQPVEHDESGDSVDRAEREISEQQAEAGVDVVNDGEMSKPSYATYIKDRLSGFGGSGNTFVYQDLVAFPNLNFGAVDMDFGGDQQRFDSYLPRRGLML